MENLQLVRVQLPDGSWEDVRYDKRGTQVESRYGRSYSTAMNVLCLSVPEGKLPFFQR